MYGRRKSFLLNSVLFLFSIVYGLVVRLRREFYAKQVCRSKKIHQKVVSVGNLTLGGTGKTPAVMNIAALLNNHNRHPVVISRGYGRKREAEMTLVSDGTALCADPMTGGDEPVLIASKLPDVPVIADSNRYRAALFAAHTFGSETIILDDGFQHLRLARDVDIVLIDGNDPFGNGKLFPAGILREPLDALARAQVILITRADRALDLGALKVSLQERTNAKIFTSYHHAVDLIEIRSGETKPLSALEGTPVLAVAGIARPSSFFELLVSQKAVVRGEAFYPDHVRYAKSDLTAIVQKAIDSKAALIVTTEKDAVKMRGLAPVGFWALRIELKVVETREWEEVLLGRA